MFSTLWYVFGVVGFSSLAYRAARRFENGSARAASILRLSPWAVLWLWPVHTNDLGGFLLEGATVVAVLLGANWYARIFLHDADRVPREVAHKS